MGSRTDQDHAREVGDRLAPPTIPDRKTIKEDRRARHDSHGADPEPTPEEEAAAERAGDLDPKIAAAYKDALERGAAQEGEGKPGL